MKPLVMDVGSNGAITSPRNDLLPRLRDRCVMWPGSAGMVIIQMRERPDRDDGATLRSDGLPEVSRVNCRATTADLCPHDTSVTQRPWSSNTETVEVIIL